MSKRDSKEFASHEDQGSGSEKEFDNNQPTSDDIQRGKEIMSEGVKKRKGDEACGGSNEVVVTKKNKYLKKFTLKDDKKVLRALLKYGFKCGSREFYRKAGLKLSVPADENQVYEKVRGLKKAFFKRVRSNKVEELTHEIAKIHKLSYKIWGGEEEAKVNIQHQEEEGGGGGGISNNSNNKLEETRVDEFKEKVDKFVKLIFMKPEDEVNANERHVLEAFHTAPIPQSEKLRLVKGWNELQVEQSQLQQRKGELISQIIQAMEASPLVQQCI